MNSNFSYPSVLHAVRTLLVTDAMCFIMKIAYNFIALMKRKYNIALKQNSVLMLTYRWLLC